MKILSKISNKIKFNFEKKKFIIVLAIVIVGALGLFVWKGQKIVIVTDGTKYDNGGSLKIKIKNISLRNLCFSSCYPYYLERKNTDWQSYSYQLCPYPDLAKECIEPLQLKAFEASLPNIKNGSHRIAVPVCQNCEPGEQFRETTRFYSNEFEIK